MKYFLQTLKPYVLPTGRRTITRRNIAKQYARQPSITPYLSLQDFNEEHQLFLLDDNKSMGFGLRLSPLACDARPQSVLTSIAIQLQSVLVESLPYEETHPWVMQIYLENDNTLDNTIDLFYQQIKDKDLPFVQEHISILRQHWDYMNNPNGIFFDDVVTHRQFHAKRNAIRVLLYRDLSALKQVRRDKILQECLSVRQTLVSHLSALGIVSTQLTHNDLYTWLVDWFNPNLPFIPDMPCRDNQVRYGFDFAQSLFSSDIESTDYGWRFGGIPHQVLFIDNLKKEPTIGHLSAERQLGKFDEQNKWMDSLFDQLPIGTRLCMTTVLLGPETIIKQLEKINSSAVGGSGESNIARLQIEQAIASINHNDYLLPTQISLFINADDEQQLQSKTAKIESLLKTQDLTVLSPKYNVYPSDSYLRQLPFNYRYTFDKKYYYNSRLLRSSDIAKLLPLYGRSQGLKDQPCFLFYNRGGEPVMFDPFKAKVNNTHMFVLGGTGAGKSSLCQYLMGQVISLYNPYIFLLEAGGSMDVFAEFAAHNGLSVNHVKIDIKNPISLNPFADSQKALEQVEKLEALEKRWMNQTNKIKDIATLKAEELDKEFEKNQQTFDKDDYEDKHITQDLDEERDFLGEMLLAAEVMITGGEETEENNMTRRDRAIITECIIDAARTARDAGRVQMIATDLKDSFNKLADTLDPTRDVDKISRARLMADNLSTFCRNPIARQFFNTPGQPWPIKDITIIDFGFMAKDGYEAMRVVAYAGLNAKMLALAEATQHEDRPILSIKDENHVFLKNKLLAAMQTRESKMARKLGISMWLLTQNMADFAEESRKILSMIETVVCLNTTPTEIDQLREFVPMTEEDVNLLLAIRKKDKVYSEGVILHPNFKGLFRNIPPKAYLAFSGTNKEEKAARRKLMEQYKCLSYEADLMRAKVMMDENLLA